MKIILFKHNSYSPLILYLYHDLKKKELKKVDHLKFWYVIELLILVFVYQKKKLGVINKPNRAIN